MVKVVLLVEVLIEEPIDKLKGLAGKPLSPRFDMPGDAKSTGLAVSNDPLRSPNKACTAVSLKP
jgi:hypothetical protein